MSKQPETPDWVHCTPIEEAYELEMFDQGGECVQQIILTREEFVGIKERLAIDRGYVQPGASDRSQDAELPDNEEVDLRAMTLVQLRKGAPALFTSGSATENLAAIDDHFAKAFDPDLEIRERAFLAICQRIYREDRGVDTPIEAFLIELIDDLKYSALTEADVLHEVDVLKDNWSDAVETAREMLAKHPELVSEQHEAARA